MSPFSPTALPEWSSDDAARLRVLLNSETGQKMFAHLLAQRPAPIPRNNETNVLIRSLGAIEGYENCLENLSNLTVTKPNEGIPEKPNLPPLDDPDAWREIDAQTDASMTLPETPTPPQHA